jgi:endonuclease III
LSGRARHGIWRVVMRRSEKAQRIVEILERLYPDPPIPLDHVDPYTLTVAVVLSAQTTDKKVNQVTPRLFEIAPTPEAMAKLEVEAIRNIIREIGLAPQKAKALRGMAEQLIEKHDSAIPEDFDALIDLPGVGRKTANVVMAQAFNVPSFPVDTHIHRLSHRWGLSRGKSPDHVEKDLCKTFDRALWNDLHLQIIYFGREHCPARFHDLTTCPICSWASTRKRIDEERRADLALRTRKKKPKRKR